MRCKQSGKPWTRIMSEESFDQCEECGRMLPYNDGTVPYHQEATTEEERLEPDGKWEKMQQGFGDRLMIVTVGR